jgi:hypothetical protein
MFRPIRVDHTNFLQVAIKTHSCIEESLLNLLRFFYGKATHASTSVESPNVETPQDLAVRGRMVQCSSVRVRADSGAYEEYKNGEKTVF